MCVSCSYIVLWKKGYQQFQEPRGTCVIKVKGVARVVGDETLLDDGKSQWCEGEIQ